MGSEGVGSLGWLLLWGGLFFVMMRYGCGAHMMGGGHGHGSHTAPGKTTKDPVCGVSVEPGNAAAAAVRNGNTYYFCSTSCRDKFELAPEKYVSASASTEHSQGGQHHG